jgi:hypothetical protein
VPRQVVRLARGWASVLRDRKPPSRQPRRPSQTGIDDETCQVEASSLSASSLIGSAPLNAILSPNTQAKSTRGHGIPDLADHTSYGISVCLPTWLGRGASPCSGWLRRSVHRLALVGCAARSSCRLDANGLPHVIAKSGRPVARLVPFDRDTTPRRLVQMQS